MTPKEIQITFDKLAFDLNMAGVGQSLLDRLGNLAASVRQALADAGAGQ